MLNPGELFCIEHEVGGNLADYIASNIVSIFASTKEIKRRISENEKNYEILLEKKIKLKKLKGVEQKQVMEEKKLLQQKMEEPIVTNLNEQIACVILGFLK